MPIYFRRSIGLNSSFLEFFLNSDDFLGTVGFVFLLTGVVFFNLWKFRGNGLSVGRFDAFAKPKHPYKIARQAQWQIQNGIAFAL